MIAAAEDDAGWRLEEAYRVFLRALRLRQAKIGYLLPLALVPAAMSLDYFVYPELFGALLRSRLLCNLALLPCYIMLFTRFGPRNLFWLGNLWLMAPMLAICWMIYASEGANSPYYAGLNLVMLAGCLLTTYDARGAMVFCGVTIACYGLACTLHRWMPPASAIHKSVMLAGSIFFNNIYFLAATGAVSVTSCYFGSRRRFEDFRLRHELDAKNVRIASTLQKLQETEVQLVQSEKMNALGKLSAGLLHEINNPLNFTFMALQIAQQESAENECMSDTLKDIGEGMERIRTVISDLRAFAYPTHHMDTQEVSLDDALTSALRLTAHELGDTSIDRQEIGGARTLGAATQIVHVFMNLLVNSAHAIKTKGQAAQIKISCAPSENGRLRVAVRDNGSGVAAADLPRLLDPFFTTKAPGQGMGLGLSICHTIVKNHGGTMQVNSELGQWTEVSFDLPLVTAALRSAA
ncbi:MAG TPA: ATP-binding protein [Tepidisphaeraceae bacterium]|jgi:two-component system sensor histidine kinase PhcS|nr:ATP-binding protein [Tepidisphaeraceae bacterium]